MICEQTVKTFCRDYSLIENYEAAIADTTQTWDCHHRLEIYPGFDRKALIRKGLYYDVNPEALIFLTHGEHMKLHKKGKPLSEETRAKLSAAKKGKPNLALKGRPKSEEQKQKQSAALKGKPNLALKGKPKSEETRAKISAAFKGHSVSAETRAKISAAKKGKPGKPHTAEYKAKQSAYKKAYWEKRRQLNGKD